MKTERTYKKNKNHRLQMNEKTNLEISDRLRLNLIMRSIVFWGIVFLIGKTEFENVSLYRQGEITEAFVYRHAYRVNLYEFKVLGIKYTGHDINSNVGDTINVAYLPLNPKISRNTEALNQDWVVWLYRKIIE